MASLLDFGGPLRYTRVPMVRAKGAARVLSIDYPGTTEVLRATGSTRPFAPVRRPPRRSPRSFPAPGWVELDADALVRATDAVAARAMDAAPEHEVLAWGLANQGETVALWDQAHR